MSNRHQQNNLAHIRHTNPRVAVQALVGVSCSRKLAAANAENICNNIINSHRNVVSFSANGNTQVNFVRNGRTCQPPQAAFF